MTHSHTARYLPILGALAVVLLPYLFFALRQWHHIPLHEGEPVGPTDPDPWLRLTLAREWLTSGDWYNHLVPRTNTPIGGITSPWTRPVDMVIAALATMQPDTVELNLRLMRAALIAPAIWMVALLMGIYRIVRLYSPLPSAYLMASLMVAAMPVTWNYFGVGNADHHAPLAALFVWVMGSVLRPTIRPAQAILAGVLVALMLWISFEAIILIAIIYLWFGLAWLRGDYSNTRALAIMASAAAITSTAALMVEYPRAQWLHAQYDTLSIVYVSLIALSACLSWLMVKTMGHPKRYLIITSAGVMAALAVVIMFPALIHGPYGGLSPYITSHFMPRISEAKPFYKIELLPLLATAYLPIATMFLLAAAWLKPRYAFYPKQSASILTYFIGTTLLLYLSQQRWSYYLLPLTSAALAPFIACLFAPEDARVAGQWPARALATLTPSQQALRRMPIIALVLALPMICLLLDQALTPKNDADAQLMGQRNACYSSARQLIRSGELTRALGSTPMNILAPTDLGTEILFFTPHRIVASNYHREGDGIQYVWESETLETAPALRSYLEKRKIDVLLVCPNLTNSPESILVQYLSGAALANWLQPIAFKLQSTEATTLEDQGKLKVIPLLLRVATK